LPAIFGGAQGLRVVLNEQYFMVLDFWIVQLPTLFA
jgi:hypothetical protein